MGLTRHSPPWVAIDLFSGAGGMSYGFHAHPRFKVVGAVDVEVGKPSTGNGVISCNLSYEANMGIRPLALDLGVIEPKELRARLRPSLNGQALTVLIACPPCTGFSRAVAANHSIDDPRNSLVSRSGDFVQQFDPDIFLMENARELITGKFSRHYHALRDRLVSLGYNVHGATHFLNRFGLPQQRERAIIIAARKGIPLRTMDDLWDGYQVAPAATTVRRAIGHLPSVSAGKPHPDDALHTSTAIPAGPTLQRLRAVPKDGGSWADLIKHPEASELLIPSMWRSIKNRSMNHYCDAYGRMAWDKPAPTIKRECAHTGNGRYAHPTQDRLCTVREMSLLQGFPRDYQLVARSRKNLYRHIGDAVPPLVSFQLAKLCEWMLTGVRPDLRDVLLPNTHLTAADIEVRREENLRLFA